MRTSLTVIATACAGIVLMACSANVILPAPVTAVALPASGPGADGYYALGRNQYAARRYPEALAAYRQALAIDPRHVNARNGLAALYAGQGDVSAAITLWQQLAAEQGSSPAAGSAYLLANLGYAYLLAGDTAQAVSKLEQACLLDPLNPLGWEHLGMALQASGLSERAAAMLRQAATLRAHDVRQDIAAAAPGLASAALEQAVAQDGFERT
ncbi:MAG: tetratricopeptide repeat protein [Sphingomonadaceae bacterium]